MLKYMKENKRLWYTYVLLVPCAIISSAAYSLAMAPLFNVVYSKNAEEFVKYSVIVIACSLADLFIHYCHKICREKLRVHYVSGLKRDIFQSLFSKDIVEFNAYSNSQYISILNKDVEKMSRCYFDSVCGIYRVTVAFLTNLILVLWINWQMAVFNIFVSLLTVFVPKLFEKRLMERQERSSENSEKYYGLLKDYLSGFNTIKIFHIQDIVKEKMEKMNQELEQSNYMSIATNYRCSWISMFCTQITYISTVVIGIYFAISGQMTVGMVMSLIQLLGGVIVPLEELPEHFSNYKSVRGIREKIQGIIEKRPEHIEDREKLEIESCEFQIRNVSFSYEKERTILNQVSAEIKSGKKYIVVGDSGCGKSTLAKLLMGFYRGNEGEILFDGRKIEAYSEKQFYEMVTYLAQDIFLFDDTLRANITLYRDYSEEELNRVIQISGLQTLISELPQGLDTVIEGNGVNFSGGEKQRIGIARALLSGAKFIIFDEVTANLDPVLGNKIEHTIMNLPETSVLYITHKWSRALLEKADEIWMMKKGQIAEQGSFKELMDLKKHFYSFCCYEE